jgi:uncharacterized membrane protein
MGSGAMLQMGRIARAVKRLAISLRCARMAEQHAVRRAAMNLFSTDDLIAIAFFAGAWLIYAVAVEWTPLGKRALNARMDRYREVWMRRMLARDMRMVDMQIMGSLQNGTAFFASTSLIAIGGALGLMRSTEELPTVAAMLPLGIQMTPGQWEAKATGIAIIFVYAFFKFAWSYRLFNYVAIMLGATPFAAEKDSADAETHVVRTARLFEAAGRHFNRGQRAFFFALGYLGWFIGPWALIASTAAVVAVMLWRQFASDARRAIDRA